MNKNIRKFLNILIFIQGGIYLYCILNLVQKFSLLKIVIQKEKVSYLFACAIILVIFGFGINIGILLLNCKFNRKLLVLSLLFSIFFLLLQFSLTIATSQPTCHCQSLSEILMNITDWNPVEFSSLLLLLAIIALVINNYLIKHKKTESQLNISNEG